MQNSPYNQRNLPEILRKVRKEAGYSQYQLGKLIGGVIREMYQTLKMVMSDLHLNCASTGSKHVEPRTY
ncbi:helix-turn-helix domain-containing protein [Bacillus sp. SL00103]